MVHYAVTIEEYNEIRYSKDGKKWTNWLDVAGIYTSEYFCPIPYYDWFCTRADLPVTINSYKKEEHYIWIDRNSPTIQKIGIQPSDGYKFLHLGVQIPLGFSTEIPLSAVELGEFLLIFAIGPENKHYFIVFGGINIDNKVVFICNSLQFLLFVVLETIITFLS